MQHAQHMQQTQPPASGRAAAPVELRELASGRKARLSPQVGAALAQAIAACMLMASLACGFSACATAGQMTAFAAAGLATVLAVHVLRAFGRGARFVPTAAVGAAVCAAVATMALPTFRSELFGFANQLIARFDDAFEAYVPLLPVAADGSGWPFFALAGILAALAATVLVRRRMAATSTVLVFALGAACLWLRTGAVLPALVLSLFAWAMVWRASLGDATNSLRSAVFAGCGTAVVLALALAATSLYQPNPAIDRAREGAAEAVDTLRYGRDSLPEGDLAKAYAMNDGDEERLVVSFDRAPAGGVLLRGFAGASYQAGAWKALDHTAYEGSWTGMFGWLSAQGFSPSTQRAAFDDENAARGGDRPPVAALSVEATGANRAYLYAPATLRTLEGAQAVPNRDGSLLAEGLAGAGSYALEVDAVDASADAAATPSWLASASPDNRYAASEAVYRSFAREHYLALDEADRTLVDELFYDPATWNEEDPAPAVVISRVRAMLATLASYTETPTAVPAGGQAHFLRWFLTQEHQGNAAYFSTAAVMAFRAQDIPARYVEGYRADAEALERAAASGEGRVALTAADAHAWVEIYLDGIGWSPVEVVPGYYDQPYQVGDVIEVNQNTAGGDSSDASPAGALAGDLEEDGAKNVEGASAMRIAGAIIAVLGVILLLACVMMALLEARRAYRRSRRAKRCAAEDQAVAVPALFDELGALVSTAGAAFSPERPFEASAAVAVAFPDVVPEEYERVVSLAQKAVFGGKELRIHEMRALRRFNARLAEALPAPSGPRAALVRRYRYGL